MGIKILALATYGTPDVSGGRTLPAVNHKLPVGRSQDLEHRPVSPPRTLVLVGTSHGNVHISTECLSSNLGTPRRLSPWMFIFGKSLCRDFGCSH